MFDQGRPDLVHFTDFRPRIVDVGEDHLFRDQRLEIKIQSFRIKGLGFRLTVLSVTIRHLGYKVSIASALSPLRCG